MKERNQAWLKKATGILQIANAAVLALWVGLRLMPEGKALYILMAVFLGFALPGEIFLYLLLKNEGTPRKSFLSAAFLLIIGSLVLLVVINKAPLWVLAFAWPVPAGYFRLKTGGALLSRQNLWGLLPLVLGGGIILAAFGFYFTVAGVFAIYLSQLLAPEMGVLGLAFFVMVPMYAAGNFLIWLVCRKALPVAQNTQPEISEEGRGRA